MWDALARSDLATMAAAGAAVGTFVAGAWAALAGYRKGVPDAHSPPMPHAELAHRFDHVDAEIEKLRSQAHRIEVEMARLAGHVEPKR